MLVAIILVLIGLGFVLAEVFFPSLGVFGIIAGTCLILATLQAFAVLAAQHGMVWVGQSEMPPFIKGGHGDPPDAINRLGSFLGLMTQSDNLPAEQTPPAGDLETARRFGMRIASAAGRWSGGTTA